MSSKSLSVKKIEFKITAPSVMSLLGERMRDFPLITAAVDLRTTVKFEELPLSANVITIQYFKVGLKHDVLLPEFLKFYNTCVENIDLLNERVVEFLNSTYKFPHCRKLVHTFYYLLVSVAHKDNIELKPFALHLSTEIEMDDELPCPASSTVCLTGCLIHWSRLQKGPHDTFDDIDFENIDMYTKCYGIIYPDLDNINVTTSTFGLIQKYVTDESLVTTIELQDLPSITILLVNSKKKQNLENLEEIKILQIEDQEEEVKMLKNIIPEVLDSTWENIKKVSLSAYDILFKLVRVHANEEQTFQMRYLTTLHLYNELKTLISVNQGFLQAIRLTNTDIDEICLIARKHEMSGKHTNICKGKYVFILCPLSILDSSAVRISRLMNDLRERFFIVTKTNLAQTGVRIEPEDV